MTIKPVVMYTALRPWGLRVGLSALVEVVYHQGIPTTGLVKTSRVQSIGTLFTKTGPKFETLNTLYVPADYLDEGTIVHCEKETQDA